MGAPRENEVGACRCPLCSGKAAKLRASKHGLAYVVCDGCKMQLFTRGDHSDTLARALLLADPAPAPAPPAPPTPPNPDATPAPPPRRFGLGGLLGG